jgi:histidinol dehydrogenase
MPLRLDASDPGFAEAFEALVNARREADPDVSDSVRETIVRVRAEGDAALIDYTQTFDRADLASLGIAVSQDAVARAASRSRRRANRAVFGDANALHLRTGLRTGIHRVGQRAA